MKTFLQLALASVLILGTVAVQIRTEVYAAKVGSDQAGPTVELITTISESSGGNGESKTEERNLPIDGVFPGLGESIASATFSGSQLPSTIKVRVTEDDGPTSKDDGGCNISYTGPFSSTPMVLKCIREEGNGLVESFIINVKIFVL